MHFLRLSPGEHQVHALLDSLFEHANGALDDKSLPALAQLASFRTGTYRAVITLCDEAYHHVLADVTRDTATTGRCLSSQPSPPSHPPRIDRRNCLFEHGLSTQEEDAPGHLLSVEDCSCDPRFMGHSLVAGEDGIRFLTAVPMISVAGQQIGVLTVSDPSPRYALSQNELDGLRECAACVVGHLELVRMSVDSSLKSSLLNGITSSIEHQYPSLRTSEGNQEGSDHEQVYNGDSSVGSPETVRPHEAIHASDSSALSSMFSSNAPDALSGAFNDTAQRLIRHLHAEEIGVYGEAGMGGVVDGDVDRHENNVDHHQGAHDERSSILLFSSSRKGEEARLDPKPFVKFLRRLTAQYPRGTALQFIAGGPTKDHDSTTNGRVPVTQDTGCDGSDSGPVTDEHIVENLLRQDLRSDVHNLVFVPVHHPQKHDLLAAFILLNIASPCNLDFSELRATVSCLSQQVAQILSRKGEADFLSNFSHELRSPIHGVMGAAQFLQDTTSSSYQTGLLESIFSCSSTLLDTLNLVLDHSKLRAASQPQRLSDVPHNPSGPPSPPKIPAFSSEASDLALLIEEATESVVSGHFFDNVTRATDPTDGRDQSEDGQSLSKNPFPRTYHDVKVILSLTMRDNWAAEAPPGAIRRIVMNLLGNSLKFTPQGSIMIALEPDPKLASDEGMLGFRIQIKDTGIGMSSEFQRDSLFTPFQQENRFESGVGLGLSIVRRLVESLDGTVTVNSKVREGTCVDIGLSLRALPAPHLGTPGDLREIASKVEGKHLVFIDSQCLEPDHEITEAAIQREHALREVASNWLKMCVSKTSNMDVHDADFYLYNEPPPAQALLDRHRETPSTQLSSGEIPLIVVATDAKEAHMIETNHARKLEKEGRIVEVLAQPCGPRKLAKILQLCMDRQQQSMQNRTPAGENRPDTVPRSLADDPGKPSEAQQSSSGADREEAFEEDNSTDGHHTLSLPSRPKQETEPESTTDASEKTPNQKPQGEKMPRPGLHGLIVDDNRVNLRLLVTLMKKSEHTYAQAEDGQQAFNIFKSSEQPFDFVLMDIGMPVMNGMEATKRIRKHEREHNLRPTHIIALTAWADKNTQEEAMAAGMDQFMSKPVKFLQLRKMLDDLRRPSEET